MRRRILLAFERLWSEGSDASLIFFGRGGWRSYDLLMRLRSHPMVGRHLFWFEDGSDADLAFAYRRASALIFASRCEGFGLPLVEAMRYGLPVLASDIPVFREVGGDYPDFFRAGDDRRFRQRGSASRGTAGVGSALRNPKPWLSWSDSAQMLLQKIGAMG